MANQLTATNGRNSKTKQKKCRKARTATTGSHDEVAKLPCERKFFRFYVFWFQNLNFRFVSFVFVHVLDEGCSVLDTLLLYQIIQVLAPAARRHLEDPDVAAPRVFPTAEALDAVDKVGLDVAGHSSPTSDRAQQTATYLEQRRQTLTAGRPRANSMRAMERKHASSHSLRSLWDQWLLLAHV